MKFDNGHENGIKYIECPICKQRFLGSKLYPGLRSFATHILSSHKENNDLVKFAEAQLNRNKAKKHTYDKKEDSDNKWWIK